MNDCTRMHQENTQQATFVVLESTPSRICDGIYQRHDMEPKNWLPYTTASPEESQSIQMSTDLYLKEFWGTRDTGVHSIQRTHIQTCGPMDILAGRAGRQKENILGKEHPGTKIFDATIARNLLLYQRHSHRRRRSCLIKKVVGDLLAQGCRFVKYDRNIDMFLVLNEKQIRDKVSFAFRHQSKHDSTLLKRIKRETPDLPLQEARTLMNKTVTISPRSINSETLSASSSSPHPSLSYSDIFCATKQTCFEESREEEDDQDFIDKIEELDVDGLMLTEEEVNTTFETNY